MSTNNSMKRSMGLKASARISNTVIYIVLIVSGIVLFITNVGKP